MKSHRGPARKPGPLSPEAEKLVALMSAKGLLRREVAHLLGVSHKTVDAWLCPVAGSSHKTMPPRWLRLLGLAIDARDRPSATRELQAYRAALGDLVETAREVLSDDEPALTRALELLGRRTA